MCVCWWFCSCPTILYIHTELCTNKCNKRTMNQVLKEKKTTKYIKRLQFESRENTCNASTLAKHISNVKHAYRAKKNTAVEVNKSNNKNSWHYLLRFEWIVTGASVKWREREMRSGHDRTESPIAIAFAVCVGMCSMLIFEIHRS